MLSNASTNALKVSAGIVISLWSLSLTVARLILRPDLRLSDEGRAFSRLTTTKSSCSKAAPRTTRRFYHLLTCLLHPSYACLHRLSEVEHDELRKLGIDAQAIAVSRPIAVVLGIHFRGNEWGKTRCGSVIVTSVQGKDRYCIVDRFLTVLSHNVARVRRWFAAPSYPYAPNPLVVCACFADEEEDRRLGYVLPVENIIPSRVYVEPLSDGIHYNLMRDSDY